jgi:long-chain acyl-CoA synthetase
MVELRESGIDRSRRAGRVSADAAGRYEIPTDIAIVDTIPRTPSGKADLSAIRTFFCDHAR